MRKLGLMSKSLFFYFLTLVLLLQGCVGFATRVVEPTWTIGSPVQVQQLSGVTPPSTTPTIAQSQVPLVTPTSPAEALGNNCILSKEMISDKTPEKVYWSLDGKSIYYAPYRSGGDVWYAYDLPTKTVRRMMADELALVQKWAQAERRRDRVYYSRSGKYGIFVKMVAEATRAPYEMPTVYGNVFFISADPSKPNLIGRLFGSIEDVYWSENEQIAVITMQQYMIYGRISKYHVYLVDIGKMELRPSFPRESGEHSEDQITILNISQDGAWLYYSIHGSDEMSIQKRNLFTDQNVKISLKYSYLWHLWPQDDRLLYLQGEYIGPAMVEWQMMALYPDETRQEIQHLPIGKGMNDSASVWLSPDGDNLVLYEQLPDSQGLFLLTLCEE